MVRRFCDKAVVVPAVPVPLMPRALPFNAALLASAVMGSLLSPLKYTALVKLNVVLAGFSLVVVSMVVPVGEIDFILIVLATGRTCTTLSMAGAGTPPTAQPQILPVRRKFCSLILAIGSLGSMELARANPPSGVLARIWLPGAN